MNAGAEICDEIGKKNLPVREVDFSR